LVCGLRLVLRLGSLPHGNPVPNPEPDSLYSLAQHNEQRYCEDHDNQPNVNPADGELARRIIHRRETMHHEDSDKIAKFTGQLDAVLELGLEGSH
jgi:hypothetical protein